MANGLTLREVRTAPRDGRHVALLFFKEPLAAIQGKRLTLAALGDKTPRHKQRIGLRISPGADGWLDKLYFLFVPTRDLRVTPDNSAAFPDGGSFAWGKLPNWDSREWLALFVDDGETRHRIK